MNTNSAHTAEGEAIGLVGRKCGMTRLFTEDGIAIPVTVLEIEPNRITQIKTKEKDGYSAVQVTTGTRRRSRVTKSLVGHYAKAGVEPGRGLWEFPTEHAETFEIGSQLTVASFSVGQYVDVTAVSKGKGFAGVIKRWHFTMGDATHGNSLSHRAPGSIGQRQTPGRVFKGKKMAGQMGNVRRTVQTQEVVRVDLEKNLLLIKGGVPGAPGGNVIVRLAIKRRSQGGK